VGGMPPRTTARCGSRREQRPARAERRPLLAIPTARRLFESADGAQGFRIDPDPRRGSTLRNGIVLSTGVLKRVRALELFVRDVYGERRIVQAGVRCQPAASTARSNYERKLMGMGEEIGCSWITVAGLDVVRDSDGSFKVLEDNLRHRPG